MGNVIFIVGPPGSGKSSSMFPNEKLGIKGLDPTKTIFISAAGAGKPLLFPNSKKLYKSGTLKDGSNHIFQKSANKIATIIEKIDTLPEYSHIKHVVVDDAGLSQMFIFMSKVHDKD